MTTPVRVERRGGQRFPYLLPVSFRELANGIEGLGFTQDVSSRGVFFLTDAPLEEGREIELTLNMPSEITLGDSMRVRCRGRILRVTRPSTPPSQDCKGGSRAETKIGVAVRLEGYEYLTERTESSSSFARIAALHPNEDTDKAAAGR